jgi:hypothetical protein
LNVLCAQGSTWTHPDGAGAPAIYHVLFCDPDGGGDNGGGGGGDDDTGGVE